MVVFLLTLFDKSFGFHIYKKNATGIVQVTVEQSENLSKHSEDICGPNRKWELMMWGRNHALS